jgi:NADH:ubiquinone oxidoreductase subunit H
VYTATKVGIIVFVWTWMRAALAHPSWNAQARMAWQILTPLAVLNLIVTALIAVVL